MSSGFHPSLLLPRGIRPKSVVSPENNNSNNNDSDDAEASPKRRYSAGESMLSSLSPSGMRRRLSLTRRGSKQPDKKKKKKYYMADIALPDEPPLVFYPAPLLGVKTSPVLFWLEHGCPQDVVPKILAYCGPQTTAVLYQCNRFWRDLVAEEFTWRIMCEDLYKWKEGDEEPDCSWREFYTRNPCVPTDYSRVSDAVIAACPRRPDKPLLSSQSQDELPARTIWLRPQEHRLQESLLLDAVQANITLETMRTTMTTSAAAKKRLPLASLLLQTRRRNKPLIHIAAGHVTLRNLRLGHYCGGFNLWNGNAAVQIQPMPATAANNGQNNEIVRTAMPSATLLEVEVISHSGRGVVINDGGNVSIAKSYIHDCAATGIYVGSNDCQLNLEYSDLISNGHGNQLAASVRASGVSRGHSGFYLENGNATLHQVNISNNSSCGISVSSAESRLMLDHSDVVANGHSNQVEVAFGAEQMGSSNNVAKTGLVKVRSRLGLQSCCGRGLGSGSSSNRRRSSRRRSSTGSLSERGNHGHGDGFIPLSEEEEESEDEAEDDLEHLQDSFVVAEENVRFGELIEI